MDDVTNNINSWPVSVDFSMIIKPEKYVLEIYDLNVYAFFGRTRKICLSTRTSVLCFYKSRAHNNIRICTRWNLY